MPDHQIGPAQEIDPADSVVGQTWTPHDAPSSRNDIRRTVRRKELRQMAPCETVGASACTPEPIHPSGWNQKGNELASC